MLWLNTGLFSLDYCLWYVADTEGPEYQVLCHLLPAPAVFGVYAMYVWYMQHICVAMHVEATG